MEFTKREAQKITNELLDNICEQIFHELGDISNLDDNLSEYSNYPQDIQEAVLSNEETLDERSFYLEEIDSDEQTYTFKALNNRSIYDDTLIYVNLYTKVVPNDGIYVTTSVKVDNSGAYWPQVVLNGECVEIADLDDFADYSDADVTDLREKVLEKYPIVDANCFEAIVVTDKKLIEFNRYKEI